MKLIMNEAKTMAKRYTFNVLCMPFVSIKYGVYEYE